jgi:hypothetical protein
MAASRVLTLPVLRACADLLSRRQILPMRRPRLCGCRIEYPATTPTGDSRWPSKGASSSLASPQRWPLARRPRRRWRLAAPRSALARASQGGPRRDSPLARPKGVRGPKRIQPTTSVRSSQRRAELSTANQGDPPDSGRAAKGECCRLSF